ncbi:Uncharacterised protein [Mycobacteroides abscessus subsp. abscessus]|nr:Uncharacterised protein [Mycobacteroides abscessus subsp. abscessus]
MHHADAEQHRGQSVGGPGAGFGLHAMESRQKDQSPAAVSRFGSSWRGVPSSSALP